MISFNQIPANQRVPLFYAEFDNSAAVSGGATQEYRTLLIGPRLAAGTVAALTPTSVTSAEQAAVFFGEGSVLADMAASFLGINKNNPLVCVGVADVGGGVAATGTLTVAGTPTAAGSIAFYVAGRRFNIGVTTSDTPTTIATALAAAIQANTLCLVSAASVAGVVTVTAKNKGTQGNEINLTHSHYSDEALPAGVTVAVVAMASGATNPDIATVWPVIGDNVQYILIVSPWTDSSNLTKVETELTDRFGPSGSVIDGYAIYGKRDTFGNLSTMGLARNSPYTTIVGMKGPSNPWNWASEIAAQTAASASTDPARPLQTLALKVFAPNAVDQFTSEERNQLLYAGIATFSVSPGGVALIEGLITTFKQNAFGSPDTSYLYLTSLLSLSNRRIYLKARITSRFPRHKLANDGTRFAAGQAVVTPSSIKAEVVTKFREWEEKALVEDFDQFKADLIVERNASNPNRVDILLPPNLVNQLIIVAAKIQFRL